MFKTFFAGFRFSAFLLLAVGLPVLLLPGCSLGSNHERPCADSLSSRNGLGATWQKEKTARDKFSFPDSSPVQNFGYLQVKGLQLSDQHGNPVQLAGMSTMGWQWCQDCYTEQSLRTLVDDWHINVLRLAMYVEEGGYNTTPQPSRDLMCHLIDLCAKVGIYCIVDWHILTPGDPLDPAYRGAYSFFRFIASKYAGDPHVIYEICNEPNGPAVTWQRIQQYANRVIPIIKNAADSVKAPHPLIICGTPQWDQLVDAPLKEGRVQGNGLDLDADLPNNDRRLKYDNAIYAFHFYSASHHEGAPVEGDADYYDMYAYMYQVLGRLPVFCSEFGTVQAHGAGQPDFPRTDKWLLMLLGNNAGHQKVSFCNWSFSDKAEGSAALVPGSCAQGNWANLTSSGNYVRRVMRMVNTGVADPSVLRPVNRYTPQSKNSNGIGLQ